LGPGAREGEELLRERERAETGLSRIGFRVVVRAVWLAL
jgi:hypothetical protein